MLKRCFFCYYKHSHVSRRFFVNLEISDPGDLVQWH